MSRGRVVAVCISPAGGIPKYPVERAVLLADHGLEGDYHTGSGPRQVSLIAQELLNALDAMGMAVGAGRCGVLARVLVGGVVRAGDPAVLTGP